MCNNGICTDHCLVKNPCGGNSRCFTEKHKAKCQCETGYTGDPYVNCINIKCTSNSDCPKTHLCQQEKCIDICMKIPCGNNATCRAVNHRRDCRCPAGYEGDPQVKCELSDKYREEGCTADIDCPINLACLNDRCRDPCDAQPCGDNAECLIRESLPFKTTICKCKPGFQGDAYTQCRPSKILTKLSDVIL